MDQQRHNQEVLLRAFTNGTRPSFVSYTLWSMIHPTFGRNIGGNQRRKTEICRGHERSHGHQRPAYVDLRFQSFISVTLSHSISSCRSI